MSLFRNVKTDEIIEAISLEKISGGGGGGTGNIFCGIVVDGGNFPTTRPDGSALVMGDYVKPDPDSTFPITVLGMGSTCTFNSARDSGVYLTTGWVVNANPYQSTAETPVSNKLTESVSGTANFQNKVNEEFKGELEKKVTQSNSTSNIVYARQGGSETTVFYSQGVASNSIAMRGSTGTVKVADPVNASDAATKSYVDSKAQADNVTIQYNASSKLEVKNAGITTPKIADGNVTTDKIANDNVTTAKIADENVTTVKLADGSVTTPKLANEAVTTAKIADSNVTTAKIANSNVTTDKLADAGVTTPKIAEDAVTISKINDGNIATAITTSATDSKLATEKAVKDGLDLKQDKLIAGDNIEIEADGKTINSNQIDDTLALSEEKTYSITKIKEEIRVNAATFRGAFDTKADLDAYSGTKEKNDRAVVTKDETKDNATTMYSYNGVAWAFEYIVSTKALELDEITIDYNASGKLEVKDGGLTVQKCSPMTPADEGKTILVKADGTWEVNNIKQYKRVSSFASVSGNTYTAYYLDTPCVVGTISYATGVYIWDSVNGFIEIANVGSGGGGSSPIYVGTVYSGGVLPATRPDGSALVIGDYVKPFAGSTFPLVVGGLTFTSAKDTGVYMSPGNWMVNVSVYQKTDDTPIVNKAVESINGTSSGAVYQANLNIEYAAAINAAMKNGSFSKTATGKVNLTLKDRKNNEVLNENVENIVFTDDTQTLKNKTINATNNTISNLTGDNLKAQTSADKGKTYVIQSDGSWSLGKAGSEVDNRTINTDANDKLQLKPQTAAEKGKTFVVQSDGSWDLGNAGNAVDDLTIEVNTDDKLQIKNEAITKAKLKKQSTLDVDKTFVVQADGTWDVKKLPQYKLVHTFAGVTGDPDVFYHLDVPVIIGSVSYEVGNYIWTGTEFKLVANVGSGSSSTPIFVGEVSPGDVFPATRPDASSLVIGDYVKPYSGSVFPFTIGSVTFTNVNDQAVYMSSGNWIKNATSFQNTSQTPIVSKALESINGNSSTANYQADINNETVNALKKRLEQLSVMPTASVTYADKIYQYVGGTNADFTHGYLYECKEILPSTSPATYEWILISGSSGVTSYNDLTNKPKLNTVELTGNKNSYDTKILWLGTKAEYDALASKTEYTIYCTTDEGIVATNNYYTKTETNALLLNKQSVYDGTLKTINKNVVPAINELYSGVKALSGVVTIEVVASQPASPSNNTIYYIGAANPYQVKLYTNSGGWTDLGSTDIDLTEYQKKSFVTTEYTANTIEGILTEIKTLLNQKLSTADIVNALNSTATDKPLSANMGKWLNDYKQSKVTISTGDPSGGNDGDIWCKI